jgi:hypothetical protein
LTSSARARPPPSRMPSRRRYCSWQITSLALRMLTTMCEPAIRTAVPAAYRGRRKSPAHSMVTGSPGMSAASCSALKRFSAATLVLPSGIGCPGEAVGATIYLCWDRPSALSERRDLVDGIAEQLLRSHPKPKARDRTQVIAGLAVAGPVAVVLLARYGLSRLGARRRNRG